MGHRQPRLRRSLARARPGGTAVVLQLVPQRHHLPRAGYAGQPQQHCGDQLLYARAVLDTVQESKQVFVLTHKMIWMADNGPLQAMIDSVSNGYYGSCFFCVNPNNFYTDIYPYSCN